MEREKWYPKECYNKNEDITRKQKAKYDREENQAWATVEKIENDLLHGLTMEERLAIFDIYHGKYEDHRRGQHDGE